jgi:hypothetical protein
MKSKIIATLTGVALLAITSHNAWADEGHTSTQFQGPKANTGTVTHTVKDGKNILTLSDDFKVPETPDPHWQVVDSMGNTYLLEKLKVKGGALKGDKVRNSITVPAYEANISKVRIWCAYAEVVLGEAAFEQPVQVANR